MEETITHIEFQELESLPQDLLPETYAELLASYLLQNSLCSAKFLWKRIPVTTKSNPELAAIWNVAQKLWLKDMPGFYQNVQSFQWSPTIAPIINQLIESQREQMLRLIGVAYSSIRIEDVTKLLGTTPEQAQSTAQSRGWVIEDGMILPQESRVEDVHLTSAEDQLGKLTGFVSFLEN